MVWTWDWSSSIDHYQAHGILIQGNLNSENESFYKDAAAEVRLICPISSDSSQRGREWLCNIPLNSPNTEPPIAPTSGITRFTRFHQVFDNYFPQFLLGFGAGFLFFSSNISLLFEQILYLDMPFFPLFLPRTFDCK